MINTIALPKWHWSGNEKDTNWNVYSNIEIDMLKMINLYEQEK